MSFLDQLFTASKSKEVNRVKLSESKDKEVKAFYKSIDHAYVKEVSSKDGDSWLNMCFVLKSGEEKEGYLSSLSDLEEGDSVDLETIEVIELEKDGKALKPRYDGEVAED